MKKRARLHRCAVDIATGPSQRSGSRVERAAKAPAPHRGNATTSAAAITRTIIENMRKRRENRHFSSLAMDPPQRRAMHFAPRLRDRVAVARGDLASKRKAIDPSRAALRMRALPTAHDDVEHALRQKNFARSGVMTQKMCCKILKNAYKYVS
jgi:hypothetical protein